MGRMVIKCVFLCAGKVVKENLTLNEGTTKINAMAFDAYIHQKYQTLTKIIIPEGINEIGYDAFGFCYSLEEVRLPSTITKIDKAAFVSCKSLHKITLQNGIMNVGCAAFLDCSALKSIEIPDSVTDLFEDTFRGCTELVHVRAMGVRRIEDNAFMNCKKLESLELNFEKITKMSTSAFYGCDKLNI